MRAIIFLGPTLSRADARAELDATYLDPVSQGDLYRAALGRPFAIGIIDGYFERIPAVWHKEILWAMKEGIHVFGASSMGALRAAELTRFGMQGVGRIFEAYHTGEFQDDDEVAVIHGDASTGYRSMSEAMVNIRYTLRHAEASGVIDDELRSHLESRAKTLFYPDRSYPQLYQLARDSGVPAERVEALRCFIAAHRIDQKRDDALLLLRTVRECCDKAVPPTAAKFHFAHTEAWDQVVDWAETQPPIGTEGTSAAIDLVAAEARLSGYQGRAVLDRCIAAELHANGQYAEFARRAHEKDALLHAHGLGNPRLRDANMERAELIAWFFEVCLRQAKPVDLERFLLNNGYGSITELESIALRDFLYRQLLTKQGPTTGDETHGSHPRNLDGAGSTA